MFHPREAGKKEGSSPRGDCNGPVLKKYLSHLELLYQALFFIVCCLSFTNTEGYHGISLSVIDTNRHISADV